MGSGRRKTCPSVCLRIDPTTENESSRMKEADTKGRLLLTGATGFVGSNVLPVLTEAGWDVRAATRRTDQLGMITVQRIEGRIDWQDALRGCDAVVHLAGRAHIPRDETVETFEAVNTEGTLRLARQAVAAGVRRFIFASTVKVHGEGRSTAYVEEDLPMPADRYAQSKWRAEQGLIEIGAQSGMEMVILRPPLIYGPGVRGNIWELVRLVDRGLPLPLNSIHNRRSLLSVANLASAIATALTHRAAVGRTFLLSDQRDFSTPEIIREIATAIDRAPVLFRMPTFLLEGVAMIMGRRDTYRRLASSLFVDSGHISNELGWRPPFPPKQGFAAMGAWYRRWIEQAR